MTSALAAVSRGVDRAVYAYLAHCARMDAWERRRRYARAMRGRCAPGSSDNALRTVQVRQSL